MKSEQETTIETSEIVEATAQKLDPYQCALISEEKEAHQRTENEDQSVFSNICQSVRTLMKEIHKLKTEKSENMALEVEERRVQVILLVMSLRKLSRIQKIRVKDSREKTTESRHGVDSVTLQLQNLLYEVAHLKKEVQRCLDFQSADQEIDLVSIEQFYMDAPKTISRPEVTVEDKHQQRLAQLHWELEQRQGQSELFDKLTQEKERIAAIITDQETKLASLTPKINNILEATQPLQTALDLPLNSKREQQSNSQYLPAPLYTLWTQASAYREACDQYITAEIQGDVETAKKIALPEDEDKTDGSDSEPEADLQEETRSQKSRSRKSKHRESDESKGDGLKQLLTLHPLQVILTISTKENNSVVVEFSYAQNLKIVTTKCSVNITNKPKTLLVDVVSKERLLISLFAGDNGESSPNPANEFQLAKFRSEGLVDNYLNVIGRPFKWAQTLAGLSFLAKELYKESKEEEDTPKKLNLPKPTECLSWQTSAEHMGNIITSIRRRLRARLTLQKQLTALETASSLSDIPLSIEMIQQHFPAKVCSELRAWGPILWSEYESVPHAQAFIGEGIVESNYLTFKAVFERKQVILEALVALPLDYPSSAPVFSLSLNWMGEQTALTNPNIKEMESEVNVYWTELVSSRQDRLELLSFQLYRIAMCLDILTEATCTQLEHSSNVTQFHKEKIFFRPTRGPERALPFKYLPKLGVFAQR